MTQSFNIYKKKLLNAGIKNAKNELLWFLEKKLHLKKEKILLEKIVLNSKDLKKIKNFVNRRIKKEPFQYIINTSPFFEIDLYVNKHVMIPRPETETIINILLKQKTAVKTALDLCTGSGNLALMLSLKGIAKKITAIDISSKSLDVAEKNFLKFNANNINIMQLNFLNQPIKNKFDLIVCNPPYISINEYQTLDMEVKKFEPKYALTDNNDGLTFYRKISKEIKNLLNLNGTLLLEIGQETYKSKIEKIFIKEKYIWHKDQNNNYRIIQIFT